MSELSSMNAVAQLVVERDDAPFPIPLADTEVFSPNKLHKDSIGHFVLTRTSREGLANSSEVATAFDYDMSNLDETLADSRYQVGTAVGGIFLRNHVLVNGVVADSPFYTIRRTPTVWIPGQLTRLGNEPPRHNPEAQRSFSYVANLWLPLEYDGTVGRDRIHAPLWQIRRDARQIDTDISVYTPALTFGEENIARELARLIGRA